MYSLSCGKRDLNPHVVANTRSLVQPVCQFQHSREQMICYQKNIKMSINFLKKIKKNISLIFKFLLDFLEVTMQNTFCELKDKYAEVSELADEQDSGSCGHQLVWVQVPSSALERKQSRSNDLLFFRSQAEESLTPSSAIKPF